MTQPKMSSFFGSKYIVATALVVVTLVGAFLAFSEYTNNTKSAQASAFEGTLTSPQANTTVAQGSTASLTANVQPDPNNPESKAKLGMGLNGLADWSTQYPFLNLMKMSRNWQFICFAGGCSSDIDDVEFDNNGYPTFIPESEKDTAVSTFFLTVPQPYRLYSHKTNYILKYDGEGILDYFNISVNESASTSNRKVITLNSPSNPEDEVNYAIRIKNPDPNRTGNHIRNMRIVAADQEQLLDQGEIFNPDFLAKLSSFKALRFMDWQAVNHSKVSTWSDRIDPDDFSWANAIKNGKEVSGAPMEVLVALGNKVNRDIWINMPHLADDNYHTQFAQYVKDNLNPNLKTYVEYSNEPWNFQFSQTQYAIQQGNAMFPNSGGEAFMVYNGYRSQKTCNNWKMNIFADQKERVRCMLSPQTGWRGLELPLMNCPEWVSMGNEPCWKNMDVVALSWYFSGGLNEPENYPTKKTWMDDPNPETRFEPAFQQLKTNNLGWGDSANNVKDAINYHRGSFAGKIDTFVGYEGGTHVTSNGRPFQEDPQVIEYDMAINLHPKMGETYTVAMNDWKAGGGDLFFAFVDIATPSKYGSWGALTHVKEETSYRWEALQEYALENNFPASVNKVEFWAENGQAGCIPANTDCGWDKIGEDSDEDWKLDWTVTQPPARPVPNDPRDTHKIRAKIIDSNDDFSYTNEITIKVSAGTKIAKEMLNSPNCNPSIVSKYDSFSCSYNISGQGPFALPENGFKAKFSTTGTEINCTITGTVLNCENIPIPDDTPEGDYFVRLNDGSSCDNNNPSNCDLGQIEVNEGLCCTLPPFGNPEDQPWTSDFIGTSPVGPAITVFNNKIYQMHAGFDEKIYTRSSASTTDLTWSNWEQEGNGGETTRSVSMTSHNGKIYQAHSGRNDKIYTRSSSDGQTWTNWAEGGNGGETVHPVTMTVLNTKLYQTHTGLDTKIYTRSSSDGQTWTNWAEGGNGGEAKNLIGTVNHNGKIYQAHQGFDNAVYMRHSSDGATWSNWENILYYPSISSNITLGSTMTGLILTYTSTSDGNYDIYTYFSPDGENWITVSDYNGQSQHPIYTDSYEFYINQYHRGQDSVLYWKKWN
jgi:hypothetical protein